MNVVIAGGGTAGHVNPALALADVLDASVSFVGTRSGAEARLVPRAGYRLDTIEIKGFDRSRPWSLPAVGVRALRAIGAAKALLREREAAVVVGMGGYVSLPVGLAARSLRIPLVVHEQNIVFGLANKVLRRFAEAVAVSFEGTLAAAGANGVFVGNPVAGRLTNFDREAARARGAERFDLDPARKTLLVFGGSLGARTINEVAARLRYVWGGRDDRQVFHIAGSAQTPIEPDDTGGLIFRSVAFVDDMTEAYALADMALCRGGATTVAELTVAGVPAIIVPYPYHRDKQQELHGRVLEEAGAAIVVRDEDASAGRVRDICDELFEDEPRWAGMRSAALGLGRPDAAEALARVVLRAAG